MRLIGVDDRAGDQLRQHAPDGGPIAPGQQRLEHVDFEIADPQTEELPDHFFDPLKTHPVGDVLIHCPTLQGMEVLVAPLVASREEAPAAIQTAVEGSGALDHLPLNPALGDKQVVGQLDVHLVRVAPKIPPLAEGASQAPDHDPPVNPQLPRAPPHLASMYSPERLAGPEEYLVPLV